MGAIEHLTIRLPADMVARLRDRIATGEFADESAAIEDAIMAAEEVDMFADEEPEMSAEEIAWVREEVAAALREYDRDPSSGLTAEQVLAHLAEEHAKYEGRR